MLAKIVDLEGHLVAITSTTCTKKLEFFDEIRTRGKCNLKKEFIRKFFQLLEELIIY